MTRFPTIKAVACELRSIAATCDGEPCQLEAEGEWIDVRLQVYEDGTWAVRYGDSQYDLDHRGYWGASSVPGDGRRFDSYATARDIIGQARDSYAELKAWREREDEKQRQRDEENLIATVVGDSYGPPPYAKQRNNNRGES